jgi:hypothetical protein
MWVICANLWFLTSKLFKRKNTTSICEHNRFVKLGIVQNWCEQIRILALDPGISHIEILVLFRTCHCKTGSRLQYIWTDEKKKQDSNRQIKISTCYLVHLSMIFFCKIVVIINKLFILFSLQFCKLFSYTLLLHAVYKYKYFLLYLLLFLHENAQMYIIFSVFFFVHFAL